MGDKEMRIRVEGHPEGDLFCDKKEGWVCGKLTGFSFRFKNHGSFVVSGDDLRKLVNTNALTDSRVVELRDDLRKLNLDIYGMAGCGKTDMEAAADMLLQIHTRLRTALEKMK